MSCNFNKIKAGDIEPFVECDASCYLLCSCGHHLWSKRVGKIMQGGPEFYISSAFSKRRYWIVLKKQRNGKMILCRVLFAFAFVLLLFFILKIGNPFKDYICIIYKDEVLPKLSEHALRLCQWVKALAQV
jgi:hypothetical protein